MSEKKVNLAQLAEIIATSVRDLTKEELAELLALLKEKYNLEPTAPKVVEVAVETVAEKTLFSLELLSTPPKPGVVKIIRVLKTLTPRSLMEAKAITDNLPQMVLENVSKEEAEALKAALEGEGAVVTLS